MFFNSNSNTPIKEKIANVTKSKWFYQVLLGLFIVAYNMVWFNKTFTLSEGWSEFYVELMSRGKVPYKDFYYFLPPLSLLEDFVIWKLSFGYFIIYRFWRLVQRVFIVELVYYIISKRVDKRFAFCAGILSTILLSANKYDLVGDYNQTQQLLVILLGVMLLKYVEKTEQNNNRRYLWAMLAGFVGGLMFLQKQTVVIASFIVFGLLFIVFIAIGFEKKWYYSLPAVAAGAVMPLLPVGIALISKGAFNDFIYQVFQDTSSKGGPFEIIVGKLLRVIGTNYGVIIIAIAVIAAKIAKEKRASISIIKVLNSIALVVLGLCCSDFIKDFITKIFKADYSEYETIMEAVHNDDGLINHMMVLVTAMFLCIVIWIIYHLVSCKIKKTNYDLRALVLAFSSVAAGYSTIMANGDAYTSVITAFIIVPTVFYLFFKDVDYKDAAKSIKWISACTVLIFIICLNQKLVRAYFWWGDIEAPVWEKTESVNIPALRGYRFSPDEKKKYEQVNDIISYYTDEDSVIWGFPYVKVYNLFQNNYNMSGFVPVLFYDVCADDYAKQEAKMLAKNPPDIVVWTDIPSCIEVHEEIYRNGGALGQRKIIDWFAKEIDKSYTLVAQVDNVFVYKYNDGQSVDRTYISRKTIVNETAEITSQYQPKLKDIKGRGTKSKPYLISSRQDLICFRNEVNKGASFEGKYFEQTADIQLPSDANWVPIGNKEEYAFKGIYDGNGYSIRGLYQLSEDNEDLALFGWLDGDATIANLFVYDAWIGGEDVAIIASKGIGRVVNCYASGILHGYTAAGIAYSINDHIDNCVAIVNVEKGIPSGISGYFTNELDNCYSNLADGIDVDSGESIDENTYKSLNEFVKKYNKKHDDIILNEWNYKDNIFTIQHRENK